MYQLYFVLQRIKITAVLLNSPTTNMQAVKSANKALNPFFVYAKHQNGLFKTQQRPSLFKKIGKLLVSPSLDGVKGGRKPRIFPNTSHERN